ncbi:MAG: C25 family cysteine peptidase [Promethearchaeota archaeon]
MSSSSLNTGKNSTSSFTIEEVSISTSALQFNMNDLTLKLANVPENVKQGKPASSRGWVFSGLPGAPQLPMRSYCILLPPNTDPTSIKLSIIEDTALKLVGEYYYSPAPFPVALTANEAFISRTTDMSYLYQEDALWPSETIQFFRIEQMRDAVLTRFSYYPCQYNPVKREVIEHRDVQVSISWDMREKNQVDPLTLKFLNQFGENIDNLADILPLYEAEVFAATGGLPSQVGSGYVIITTNAIETNSQKLDDFVQYKQLLGFTVQVITEDEYGSATGKQRALNIRSWLQNHYITDSIEYVLLIGNPDPDEEGASDSVGDVPMLMCWPRINASTYKESPTDYFYADLTGNWNTDNDSYYGEYGDDYNVDFAAEVYVGRIPVYNAEYSALDTILQGIMDHHINAGSEKTKVLLPMAISNYANEDYGGYSRTDGLDCPENTWNNILSSIGGITDTVMYERSGLSAVPISAFHYDMPLNSTNVINEMNNGHGAVFWWGHGSNTGVYRKYWSWDDGDSVPEAGEMSWPTFLQSSDMSSLETDQPCFTYQSSCENGHPEATNNLGYALLKQGAAVSTVASSRVSWYAVGTWDYTYSGSVSDNTGLGYYYMRNLLQYNQPAGMALFSAKSSGGVGWGDASWMNKMDFNLFGDPQLNYWGSNQPNAPTNPSPSNDTSVGTSSVTLNVDVSDPDGDTLAVTFYNATDDSIIDVVTGISSGGTASVTWSSLVNLQTYSWYVIVADGQVTRQSSTWSFDVDTIAPTWDVTPTSKTVEFPMSFIYDVDASDNIAIDHYWINDSTYFIIDSSGIITNKTKLDLGNYWIEVRAYDPANNYCTATIKVSIQDSTTPTWDQTLIDQSVDYGMPFVYDVNASDICGIDYYWINDTTLFSINNAGVITNATKLNVGVYWLEVRAYDPSLNYCSMKSKIIVQEITYEPNTSSTITSGTVTATITPLGLLSVLSAAFIITLIYYRRRTRKRLKKQS